MNITIRSIKTDGMSREDWLTMRKTGLGGSDMGKVLGLSDWGTAVDVWLEKTGRKADAEQNESMWIGNMLEDAVARRYADERGVSVRRHNFMLIDDDNHIVGNIDRLVAIDPKTAPAHAGTIRTSLGLEVKTTSQDVWDGIPETYKAQIATYMALAPSIEAFDVATLFYGRAKDFRVYTEVRNEDVLAALRERAKEFWERYVMADVPPPPTCEEDCRTIWAASRPETKRYASEAAIKTVADLKDMTHRIAELEKAQNELRTAIMAEMEDAEVLVGTDGKKLASWKSNKESTKTDWKAVAESVGASPDVIAEHTVIKSGARVFRVA